MSEKRFILLALQKGVITCDQVQLAESEQRRLADRGIETSVWDQLLELRHLSDTDATAIRKASSNRLKAVEIDGYVIQNRIGTGGMGDVFLGINAHGQEAAIKMLAPRFTVDEEHVRRFDREARASMRLSSPFIARCLGAGQSNDSHFLLMELVKGPTLKEHLADHGPLSESDALCLLEQMAQALGYAWSQGVLHRDVKPANIVLCKPRPGHREPFCAKLIDFGLAKLHHAEGYDQSEAALTGAGMALGTPHYMSPEQAMGTRELDQRTDIYSLGASLYHALMGRTMYTDRNSEVIMYKQASEQIDLSELRKMRIRGGLIELLEQMLMKNRAQRILSWDHVLAVCAELKAIGHASTRARTQAAEAVEEPANLDGIPVLTPIEGHRVISSPPGAHQDREQLSALPGTDAARTASNAAVSPTRRNIPMAVILTAAGLGVIAVGLGLWIAFRSL